MLSIQRLLFCLARPGNRSFRELAPLVYLCVYLVPTQPGRSICVLAIPVVEFVVQRVCGSNRYALPSRTASSTAAEERPDLPAAWSDLRRAAAKCPEVEPRVLAVRVDWPMNWPAIGRPDRRLAAGSHRCQWL